MKPHETRRVTASRQTLGLLAELALLSGLALTRVPDRPNCFTVDSDKFDVDQAPRDRSAAGRQRAGKTSMRQTAGSAAAAAAILAATASNDESFVLSPAWDASMGLTS